MSDGLVHVRTTTYRRPAELRRCLGSLQAQGWRNWVCDVHDDDPDGSGADVCRALGDPRILYTHNRPQLFASRNIDQCFTRANPHGADYFCVVEDDNFILDGFFADNAALCETHGVEVVLRNQLIEMDSGTQHARLGERGVLDDLFTEGLYDPAVFRLSLLMGIGVSNGGLFWTRRARSNLEIGIPCNATLQEDLRTFAIREPIYVAMKPLAVWAENAAQTTRNAGATASGIRRELDLKRSLQQLRRRTWRETPDALRDGYLTDPRFTASAAVRAEGLVRSLIRHRAGSPLSAQRRAWLTARALAAAAFGRPWEGYAAFMPRVGMEAADPAAAAGQPAE